MSELSPTGGGEGYGVYPDEGRLPFTGQIRQAGKQFLYNFQNLWYNNARLIFGTLTR